MKIVRLYHSIFNVPMCLAVSLAQKNGEYFVQIHWPNFPGEVFLFQNLPRFIIQHLLQLWRVIFRSVVGETNTQCIPMWSVAFSSLLNVFQLRASQKLSTKASVLNTPVLALFMSIPLSHPYTFPNVPLLSVSHFFTLLFWQPHLPTHSVFIKTIYLFAH